MQSNRFEKNIISFWRTLLSKNNAQTRLKKCFKIYMKIFWEYLFFNSLVKEIVLRRDINYIGFHFQIFSLSSSRGSFGIKKIFVIDKNDKTVRINSLQMLSFVYKWKYILIGIHKSKR